MTTNPYAAPKAAVADDTVIAKGDYVPGGQPLASGRGWGWIADAWGLFKRQPGLWVGMFVVLMVIFIAAAFIPFLGSLLTVLFWPVFTAGLVIGARALDEGGELELAHLFAGFHERMGTLVGVGALYLAATLVIGLVVGLVVGVSVFAAMGGDPQSTDAGGAMVVLLAVLIMTALLLPVAMAVWFAPPLVVFQGMGALDAMKESFVGCLRNIVPFLIYGLALFGLGILALIPFGLGMLVLGPVVMASMYTAYRDIYFKPRP